MSNDNGSGRHTISEDDLLARFKGVKRRREGEWMVLCPAHSDRNPSLHITRKDGLWLLRCMAECETDDILHLARLSRSDLGSRRTSHLNDAKQIYEYVDEHGHPLFEVGRFADKKFLQRRAGQADWKGGINGVRRVLYHLPKVIAAVKDGQTVWLAEGEKDVASLERAGAVATCNPMGAGKWRDEYSEHLRGATVMIVSDKDKPGRDHAQQVAQSLSGIASSVTIVEAAEGKDASDHLVAGRKLDEFVPATPSSELSTLTSFSDIIAKPIFWAWQDRIALGKITALAGRPKIGKGLLYSHLAAQVTRGTLEGDLKGPRNAIIVTTEDDEGDTLKPRLMAAGADQNRVFTFQMGSRQDPVPFRVPQDTNELRLRVQQVEAALIVVDPLVEFIDGKVDSHKSQPVRQAVASLNMIAREVGCAILVIFHLNKGSSTDPLMRHEGSAAFTQIVRAGLLLGHDPDDPAGEEGDRRVLAVTSSNLSAIPPSLVFEVAEHWVTSDDGDRISTARLSYFGESDASGSDLLQPDREQSESNRPALDEATDFLQTELSSGPKLVEDVHKTASRLGIAKTTLKRARQGLDIKATPTEFGGPWEYRLQSGPGFDGPDCGTPDGPDCESSATAGDSANGTSSLDHPVDDGPDWAKQPSQLSLAATPEESLADRLLTQFGEQS